MKAEKLWVYIKNLSSSLEKPNSRLYNNEDVVDDVNWHVHPVGLIVGSMKAGATTTDCTPCETWLSYRSSALPASLNSRVSHSAYAREPHPGAHSYIPASSEYKHRARVEIVLFSYCHYLSLLFSTSLTL